MEETEGVLLACSRLFFRYFARYSGSPLYHTRPESTAAAFILSRHKEVPPLAIKELEHDGADFISGLISCMRAHSRRKPFTLDIIDAQELEGVMDIFVILLVMSKKFHQETMQRFPDVMEIILDIWGTYVKGPVEDDGFFLWDFARDDDYGAQARCLTPCALAVTTLLGRGGAVAHRRAVRKGLLLSIQLTLSKVPQPCLDRHLVGTLESTLITLKSLLPQYSVLSSVVHSLRKVDELGSHVHGKDLWISKPRSEPVRALWGAWEELRRAADNRLPILDEYNKYVVASQPALCSNQNVSTLFSILIFLA